MQNNTTNAFLQTGLAPKSNRERSAIMDDLRSQILTNQNTDMKIFNKTLAENINYTNRHFQASTATEFEVEATKIKAIAAKARAIKVPTGTAKTPPIIHRAATPTAIAAPIPGLVTAAAFAKPQMTMLRSEWQNLSEMDKSRFFAEGGKLAQDPEPPKATHKGGQLTRHGFNQLSPKARNEYIAKGNRLAE